MAKGEKMLLDSFMTPQQLAKKLGVGEDLLQVWRVTNMGPKFIRDKQKGILYLKNSVDEFLSVKDDLADSLNSVAAAKFLGMSYPQFQMLNARHEGPKYWIYNLSKFFRKQDLIAWQEGKEDESCKQETS